MMLTKYGWMRAGRWMQRGTLALALALALVVALVEGSGAQGVTTTTVQGTVYLANGQPGAGTLVVSWPAFTTAAGQMVAADRVTVTIPADGFVSVNLAPNQGATPAGEYYTATFYMSDGTVSTQYWVVPAAAQATLAQVQAQVMPAAQAVQTVSKAYVDQAIQELDQSMLAASGGTLDGPLTLSGDPTQPLQAADKHYVDTQVATAVPLAGGTMTGALTLSGDPAQALEAADKNYVDTTVSAAAANAWPGLVLRADEFTGADFGAKLQACLNAVNASYGGTCDARNFSGNQSMGSNLTISTANTAVLLPCATITTASQIVVTAGTRNVALHGCALRGGTAASGSTGGTAFAYTGAGAMVEVGDPTYATDTPGFHMDNVVINTTGAASGAQGLIAYRTQELDLEGLYFLGNQNQTGMTLDGTGNYTGGTFLDDQLSGFGTAVNAIGHQSANAAITDWMNASTFVRLHIDCPTSGGNPISGTYGINLQQGDGNTFTGGDVEGCSTALHLGPNAEDNTIVGLRNENSTNQVVADAGSGYNDWITGGTMFTGELTDNGTRNSFLDTFHRSFNGLNGDWYGSQQDATVTNHYRLGTGTGNERGLLDRYQTDYGYRWTTGLSDATAGEQSWQILDQLNNVYRLSIGQYLSATANVVTNVIVNNGGCYSSSDAPTVAFSGGGGSGAAGTANMTTTTSLSCPAGYTVGSVTMASGGSGYTTQPTVSFTGSNQTAAPHAVAEITTVGSTNDQTVINAAGTGAVVLNGSNNAGTGGVVFGSGGPAETTVATISNGGNAQFNGTLQVGGTAQTAGTMTVRNNADAEVDYYLWPGLTASQKGSFTYKDWNGNSQWYLVKDASNNWALNSAVGGLDSFKAYQSTNSGDTYIDASNSTGHIRLNYESGSGAETDIYSGSSGSLAAAFQGPTSIKFPGLAAPSGHDCLQVDNSGYLSNTGSACGSGSGTTGTINTGNSGQIAYYTANGTSLGGLSAVPLTAGGTGATTAAGAMANLLPGATADGKNGVSVAGAVSPSTVQPSGPPILDIRNPAFAGGAICDGTTSHPIDASVQAAINALPVTGGMIQITSPGPASGGQNCYWSDPAAMNYSAISGPITFLVHGIVRLGTTWNALNGQGGQINILGYGGGGETQFQAAAKPGMLYLEPASGNAQGTLGTAINPGTVALTNNSATVTGSGTNWNSSLNGDKIVFTTYYPAGSGSYSGYISQTYVYTISTVSSATSLTLTSNWTHGTVSNATYGGIPTTFTPSNMSGLTAGAFIGVNDPIVCNITSISRSSNKVTANVSTPCHIPPEGNGFSVSGVTDSSFNGTFSLLTDDYVKGVLTWTQTGSDGSSSGGTVSGTNSDTPEVAQISSCGASTCTAIFYQLHASTAIWGVAALAIGTSVVKDMSIQDYSGPALYTYYYSYMSKFIDDGFTTSWSASNDSYAAEVTGNYMSFSGCSFSSAGNPPWSIRLTVDVPLGITNGSSAAFTIDDSFFNASIWQARGAQAVTVSHTVDETPTSSFLTEDFSQYLFNDANGAGNTDRLEFDQYQDSTSWGNPCIVNYPQPSAGFSSPDVEINQFYYPVPGCVTNDYFDGTIRVRGPNGGTLKYGNSLAQGMLGTLNDGKKFSGELNSEGAGLGPSVVPFQTANTTTNPSGWTCVGTGCAVTTGKLAPDGTMTAGELTNTSGNSYITAGSYGPNTPAVGDYILFGAWVYSPTYGNSTLSVGPQLQAYNGGHYTLNNSTYVSSQRWDSGVVNDGWHALVGLAEVTSSDGSGGQYTNLRLTGTPNQAVDYWMPFMIYIPASAGIPLPEIMRWRTELLHGAVPPNWNNPGVAVTTQPIASVPSASSFAGSSGTATCSMGIQGTQKYATCYLNGYAQTGTAQTFTFPMPYSTTPILLESGGSCGSYNPTATAAALTLPANAAMTAETCNVAVIGQ